MSTKYTLITGASKGIGLELARIFAKEHYNLILVARSKDLLEELQTNFIKEYDIKVEVIALDLTKTDAAEELYQKVHSLDLEVEHLINNAGFGDYGEFLDTSLEKAEQMIQLNILTLVKTCHLFGQDMKKAGYGKIMNVGSIASFIPGPLMATYYATKAFVLSFTEALSVELKDAKISVTALCPGTTRTNFFEVASASKSDLLKKMKPVCPYKVALYGYKKMMKKKVVALYGFKNRLLVFMTRFAPRKLVRSMVYQIQKKRKEDKKIN